MKQKKMILGVGAFLASCAFGGMITSCTSESLLQEPAPTYQVPGKVPVVLDIKGLGDSTRAENYQAAFEYEKEIKTLLAVVFNEESNTLYKVIEVTIPDAAENRLPYFDLEQEGDYRIYFVANPGDDLKNKIEANVSTPDDLKALNQDNTNTGDIRVGSGKKNGIADGFLMIENNPDGKKVTPVANGVTPITITLQRAAARFDVLNDIKDLAVTAMKFEKYAASTFLFPQDVQGDVVVTDETTVDLSSYGTDGAPGLLGNNTAPGADGGGYVGDFYTYEWMKDYSGPSYPKITLTYKQKDATKGWTDAEAKNLEVSFIKFKKDNDGNYITFDTPTNQGGLSDEDKSYILDIFTDARTRWGGLVPELNEQDDQLQYIPIERNHLYRVRVVKAKDVNNPLVTAVIEVADWSEGMQLNGGIEKTATWEENVKKLYAYRFMPMPMVNALDPATGLMTLSTDGSQSELQFPAGYVDGQTFKIGNYDNTSLFASLRDGTMADASFIVPSVDDLAAIFPICNSYDSTLEGYGEYTEQFTHGGMFGDIMSDHAYAHFVNTDVELDGAFVHNPMWMVRFVGTDQCALYKYSMANNNESDNKLFIEVWPLTKDAKLVTSEGTYTFDTASVATGNFSFKKEDGTSIAFADWAQGSTDILGLGQLSAAERTNFNAATSTLDKKQLVFEFDINDFVFALATSNSAEDDNVVMLLQPLSCNAPGELSVIAGASDIGADNTYFMMRTISNQPKK